VVNLKPAKALDLAVPQSIPAHADERLGPINQFDRGPADGLTRRKPEA
jgi:hypothetical protein